MEKCTLEHFTGINDEKFKILNIDKSYCIPKNFSSTLFHNGTHNEFAYISLRYCKTENPNCKDLNDPGIYANFTSLYGEGFTANMYF